ncbi:MAG: sialidase family protein [Armatimonadota bacterium]
MHLEGATTVVGLSEDRRWNGIASIERTPGGRLYVVSYTGGPKEPHPENHVILCWSDDAGESWTEPIIVAERPGTVSCVDPCLWVDPRGRLWLQHTVDDVGLKRPLSVRASLRCDEPDADEPELEDLGVFCPEAGTIFTLNRATILGDERILVPLVYCQDPTEPHQHYFARPQLLGCAISDDEAETWRLSDRVEAPDSWSNENVIVELRDGRLWMLARSRAGHLWQCHSDDRGETWGEVTASEIPNHSSRFFIGRLASGRLMLVNNPEPGRDPMEVWLSEDEGQTWPIRAELMRGAVIAYPDAVQDPDGLVHCVVDVDRERVEYRCFTENGIVAAAR